MRRIYKPEVLTFYGSNESTASSHWFRSVSLLFPFSLFSNSYKIESSIYGCPCVEKIRFPSPMISTSHDSLLP